MSIHCASREGHVEIVRGVLLHAGVQIEAYTRVPFLASALWRICISVGVYWPTIAMMCDLNIFLLCYDYCTVLLPFALSLLFMFFWVFFCTVYVV